ncbi:MAG: AtpZ/AtpI family protein [SAR324 cluster bacterium]|nr:AtpZ/AtpI family protein [SAR324 cluster bacterium]MBF0349568.1 AtpZ/AtpI family protein [SAR324 cluster bacterium]
MQWPKLESKWLMFSSMGLELGLSVVVGCVVGQYLDRVFGTTPWLFLLFVLFGVFAGYRSIYRLLRKLQNTVASEEHEKQEPSP